ncbi:hypothetical protein TRAPUB_210 [Trametes pubescens]|uniref:Secreted protein n=1 Tax=Trametes pubescens TaxID=154538 RepID=A0A1M2VMM6_TRAPU|nr:hypothetical protein TRAPUB_210 [Trametes pubescens]
MDSPITTLRLAACASLFLSCTYLASSALHTPWIRGCEGDESGARLVGTPADDVCQICVQAGAVGA